MPNLHKEEGGTCKLITRSSHGSIAIMLSDREQTNFLRI